MNQNMFMLSDKTYDFVKRLVQIILPAFSALYFGLAQIWGLPAAEEVVGTIALLTTFLGVVLGISTSTYKSSGAAYDGRVLVTIPEDGPKQFMLELNGDPEELENRESITFKVGHNRERPLQADDI